MAKKIVKSDVLCIGGGPAGLMAAIRARELGASVVVADKSNTLYSGSGSGGNDHYSCYIPEYHGKDPKPILQEWLHAPAAAARPEFAETWLEKSFEIVKLWDSWGIPMKWQGKWEFAGHAFPGRPRIALKYSGGNQKPVLTEQALKRGAQILNRVTVFELLGNNKTVTGALGYDAWNNQLIEFQSKSVCLGTGGVARLYPSTTPGWLFNLPFSPTLTGDGRAMMYRLGGSLFELEFTGQWAGPKYFARAGKATWIGVLRKPNGQPVGPFITKPNKETGDITSDAYTTVFDDYMKSGEGPVYMDCAGASDEDIEYMIHWLIHEGNKGVVDHLSEEGIDPRKKQIEFRTYEIGVKGGIWFNPKSETTIRGLYAAGDEYFGGMANATIWGWVAGENAAKYAKTVDFTSNQQSKEKVITKAKEIDSITTRTDGATWQEANIALQQLMWEYCGLIRSDTLLSQGLLNLSRLKQKALNSLQARNGHEVGRCFEVLDLMDVGEAVMLCARERKETRGKHNRTDYPFTNPLLDKHLFIKKIGDKPVFDWKEKNG